MSGRSQLFYRRLVASLAIAAPISDAESTATEDRFDFESVAEYGSWGQRSRVHRWLHSDVVLFILSSSPYGTDKVYHGLRLAAALATQTPVRIFLLGDAASVAVDGQSGANDDTNLGRRLAALVADGVEVAVCGLCLETRGLHQSALLAGVQVGSMPALAGWTLEAERVVSL